jgi:hypothetical protein
LERDVGGILSPRASLQVGLDTRLREFFRDLAVAVLMKVDKPR